MILRAYSKCPFNTDMLGEIYHNSRKPVPGFDHPLHKEVFPHVKPKHFPTDTVLSYFQVPWHRVSRRRDKHIPLHFPFSRSCRHQWGCSSASSPSKVSLQQGIGKNRAKMNANLRSQTWEMCLENLSWQKVAENLYDDTVAHKWNAF